MKCDDVEHEDSFEDEEEERLQQYRDSDDGERDGDDSEIDSDGERKSGQVSYDQDHHVGDSRQLGEL